MIKCIKYIILIVVLFLAFESNAQLNVYERQILKEANDYFDDEEFDKALPLLLEINYIKDDYNIKYKIGACYLNTKYERLKAIPYLESVSSNMSIEVPLIVHYDLGMLYHYTYRFEEAIIQFEKYISNSKRNKFAEEDKIKESQRMINICHNAIEITTQPFKAEIDILGTAINTMESEYCPMVTADNNTLVYMRKVGIGKVDNPTTSIMISRKAGSNKWGEPQKLNIEDVEKYENLDIALAGLSADGQTIFLNIGKGLEQDIFKGKIEDNVIKDIEKLNSNINTPYYEGRVSLTSNGMELYFVSNRPGGFGGTDIYKSVRTKKGDWGVAENIGQAINTKYNENSPFIHPDNITIFFSSEGHKTIGGNDIFRSTNKFNAWSEPENLGFPNSTKDDLYFVLNASGQIGYFSTSKNNIYNKHNIFKVNLRNPIPLTLLKGVIKVGNPPKPTNIDIKVYDQETGLRVKYVYNPDPETGRYLMIFPPAKNYNIIVTADGYLPQSINVFIPYQTYFYELYQEITLEPISISNKTIGEKITVNNTFYDLYKTEEADSIIPNSVKQPEYYDHLLELVENIIQTTDTMKINYVEKDSSNNNSIEKLLGLIEEAIQTTDPVTLNILDANTKQKDKIKETHFYIDGDKDKSLQMQIIGGDTLYTASPIMTKPTSNSTINITPKEVEKNYDEEYFKSSPLQRNYIHHYTIYYDVNKYQIPKSTINNLDKILEILVNNQSLGVEILGYADSKGAESKNMTLSRQRLQKVLRYLTGNNIARYRIVTKAYGETKIKKDNQSSKSYRKVDINIFEIKK
jgi:outer membrane protein OmpA-like peptidoglycan-associated protein/tetratricopeptide (TPR) repeat protein